MKHAFLRILAALALGAACATPFAVFDPVNDDSDLFRNNPNIPAERPNVLIILDNTANWSSGTKFTAEKAALVATVAALDSSYNVGLMIFTQGGQCQTSNVDGAYVRFAVRQLTDGTGGTVDNKAALTSVVNGFQDASCNNVLTGGDQGSAAVGGQAMHEAYLYFAGLTSRSGITQERRDFNGNTNNTLVKDLGNNAHSSAAAAVYNSPITDACAKNYIIFISNGPFSNGDDSPSSALYAGSGGLVPGASIITLNPGGSQSSWVDEYAFYLANIGVNRLGSNQKVFTYAVEVDAVTTGGGPGHSALMQSMATQGKGKYFSVTSAGAGAAIVDALLAIFNEIQAVNSVFAASTLPVSVNVRGTNLNQLYIGVFRPDSVDRPRWFGNLKAYQLKRDSATNTVFTVDAAGVSAINSSTGFITSSAESFWTSGTVPNATYWSFRSADVNGVGGSADLPDGDLVEKGGAAQQIRGQYFANGPNGTPFRPLYTCTQGAFATCKIAYSTTPSLLSATPFSTANTDISATALSLDSRSVLPLSALVTKTVTSIVDTRSVSLSNAGAGGSAGTLSVGNNAAVGITLSNAPTPAISISAMSNGAQVRTESCQASGTNNVAKIVFAAAHGLPSTGSMAVDVPSDSNSKYIKTSVTFTTGGSTTEVTYSASGVNASASTVSCNVTTSNTTTNVTTTTAHGFGAIGSTQTATITGASPAQFSITGGTITITGTNTFSFSTTLSVAPTLSSATVSSATSTVKATCKVGGCFTGAFGAGQKVTIAGETSGTTPSYNGSFTILSSPAPTTSIIYYSTVTANTTAAAGSSIIAQQTAGTATVTFAAPIGVTFTHGQTLTIDGATPTGYNGSYAISCATNDCTLQTSFTYSPGTGFGAITANTVTASSGFQTQVTATLANHGYAANDVVTIAGATGANHNGSFTVLTTPAPTATAFFYNNAAGNTVAPGGSPTVRLTTNPRGYATIASHGYGAAGTALTNLSIIGALPAGYVVTNNSTGLVVDTDTISYVLPSGVVGTQTSTSISATSWGLTATATSAAHGYITGQTVTISGASPSGFNGEKSTANTNAITVTSANTFTYPLATAAGDATGTITVVSTGSGTSERDNVINWIRGEDNYEDENANSSFTDTRASIHGDVLHSRPAVVNYNRRQSDTNNIDNDVYIYYGGNDGIFRSVKGGFGSSTTTTYTNSSHMPANDPLPGEEVWGFVAKEHFPNLRRLRINSPGISSAYKKPYFFDGPIGTYTLDSNGDGMLDPANKIVGGVVSAEVTGDKVWIFLGMRRGGRFIYALDVSNPLTPKMMWRKGCPSLETTAALIDSTTGCDLGWGELGQTWSEPKVISTNASTDPVLFFGAGYDALVEDLDPAGVTSSTTASVVANSTTYNRSMGRGIYAVNAKTGAILWQARGGARADSSTHPYLNVPNMTRAIPSDIAVVVGDPTPKPFRAYVGDTAGSMWRIDFGDVLPANWTVAQLASIGDQTTTAGRRKFMFAPDVIGTSSGHDMVIAGTGDREHPFDTTVQNRVYAFKDKRQTQAAVVSGTQQQAIITEANTMSFNSGTIKSLRDVSTQCIEIPGNCLTTAPEAGYGSVNGSQNTSNALTDTLNEGWFITLASGEKQVGGTLAAGSGIVQFATNQPSASAGGGACSPNLGVARQYAVNYLDGTAYNGTTLSTLYAGGGFLPSPVLVFVGLGGASGTGTTTTGGVSVGGNISGGTIGIGAGASTGGSGNVASAVVCYGASCSIAPGTVLFSRVRKFWYKEID